MILPRHSDPPYCPRETSGDTLLTVCLAILAMVAMVIVGLWPLALLMAFLAGVGAERILWLRSVGR